MRRLRVLGKSPGAIRARKSRARQREGKLVLRLVVDRRRLAAALRAANRLDEDVATADILQAKAHEVVGDFMDRWLGKKPCA